MSALFDQRMRDGSRHFCSFRERYSVASPEWTRLRDHVTTLAGVESCELLTDDVTEAWLDWRFAGHAFSAHNPFGEWWVFVRDPACPDEILARVRDHLAVLLEG